MKHFTKSLIVCLLILSFVSFSQTDHHHDINSEAYIAHKFQGVQLVFDTDSLRGFDEITEVNNARMTHAPEWEQKLSIAYKKRRFIDFKYGINNAGKPAGGGGNTPQAPCTNVGFETGTTAGWTLSEGSNTNSLTQGGCCPTTPTTRFQVVTGGTDPIVGALQRVPPGGGNNTLRLGEAGTTGGFVVRARQTFSVTPMNSIFIYKFAVVLEDAGDHFCDEQAYFNISFLDGSGTDIPCSSYNVVNSGNACSSGDPSFATSGVYKWKDWTTRSFDLTNYIGQNVTIEFTAGDCTLGGHAGWAYVDASCQPMTLNLNGADIPVGQTTTNFCAVGSNTLTAPPGFVSYTWTGPGVTGATTQSILATSAGVYSVTLGMAGSSCSSPVLYSNFNLVPKPLADFNFTTTACQSTFNIPFVDASTLNGGPAITNWYWDFDGNGTFDNFNQNTINTYSPVPGVYNVKLKVSNGGCTDSIVKVVNINPSIIADFNSTSACLNSPTTFSAAPTPSTGVTAHAWDFGDGGSDAGPTPAHTYTSSGSKIVTYTVTNTAGCQGIVTKTVTVFPSPIMSITANTVCMGVATTFGNTSSVTAPATITNWAWDFDNNGVVDVNTQTPVYTYTNQGTFTAVLTATTNNGCVNSTSVPVVVNGVPTASFTPVNACTNSNVSLNNSSTAPLPTTIASYAWNFGTNSSPGTSTLQTPPSLSYNTPGPKSITLVITANTSCTATITQTLDIYPSPVANFSTTSVCQGTATAFTDLSTPVGSITAWDWDFTNNGTNDNFTNAPTHVYTTSGTFTAELVVTSSNGCKDTIALPVNVWGHTIPNFSATAVCYGTPSSFTNQTDETTNPNVGSGTTYLWDFNDASATSNATSPSYPYTSVANGNATYNVTLTATSQHNCVDFVVKPVNVYAIPTASFTSDSVCLGTATRLIDASNGNGNTVNTYAWDFSINGVDVTGVSNPNYIFPVFGNNSVSYTISTSPVVGLVCSNSTNTITVWVNPNPVPDFTFVNNCINAQPNTFDASSSSIAVGTNSVYGWSYGDSNASLGNAVATSSHIYNAPGTYNVILTVTSNKGCQKNITKQVEVYAKPNVLIANSSACDQSAMTFTSVAQANSGTVTNWAWDFNNSITTVEGTGQTSSFLFPGPGSYTVGLITESTPGGCKDTIRKVVYVNYVPVPNFSVDIPSGCPEHCVTFTDLTPVIPGPAQISQWQWVLGDGTIVTNPSNAAVDHCYTNTSNTDLANFDVRLVVTTDAGCRNTIDKLSYITVFPKPLASYTITPNPGNIVTPLEYFTNGSIGFTKWKWEFGDGSPQDSVNVNPAHLYSDETATTYNTILFVENQYGCRDIAYRSIEILPEFTFYIPNAFSPFNDDGVNDVFTGKGIGIAFYEMWIFDRWGEKIFYTDDINKGWNGKVQGKSGEEKQDVYTWKVKLKDVLGKKHDYIGHVTLVK